jgi:uncharacterized protein (DUF2336 family)
MAANPEAVDTENKTESERQELAKIVGRFLNKDASEQERMAAEQLANLLARDATVAVRNALAQEVRNCRFIPKELAIKIADDVEEISSPFLLGDGSAFDVEMLETLARECNESAREVIARREGLPEPVSYAICEVGQEKAITNLMENPTAQVSEKVCKKVTERFGENTAVLDSVAGRADLSLNIIDEIIKKISKDAASRLVENYDVGPELAAYVAGEAKTRAMSDSMDNAPVFEQLAYFRRLYEEGMLNDGLLLQILQKGKVNQFAVAASIRSLTNLDQVTEVLREGKREHVMRLFESMKVGKGLDVVLFQAFSDVRDPDLAAQ